MRRSGQLLYWVRAAIVVAVVLVVDRLTKQAVESGVHPGEERSFLPGVQIVHTHNNGVAFGLLGGSHVYLTVAIALAVVVAIVIFAWRVGRGPTWLPVGLILGGALGNVIDRIRLGSVTDFIKLPLGWPPFNVADACITVGVVVLALLLSCPQPRERDA
ncbi:MAG TPA: signal peptidase II [Solirubrobacteraceae bacterium]|nr:signal peptidase II [Solirubrobacteraceae bacterium]